MTSSNLDRLNQREFRKLLLSIKASSKRLDLLLAICDDRNLQAQLIEDYETELAEADIATFRARLDPKQPSLRAALEELAAREPALRDGPAMVTVLNASNLLGVRLNQEQSEQERFFFSLQWTREALRQFEFPVVLWLADSIATRLSRQAPDFWSWRSGVFEFAAQPPQTVEDGALTPVPVVEREEKEGQLSVAELERQVAELEQSSPESPLLITLYNSLGEAYEEEYRYFQALEQYEKALALAEAKGDEAGQARALRNLGDSLRHCGRPFQSLGYYQRALALYRELEERQGEAASLGNLGNAYDSLGQYQQAIDFHQQSLEIKREIGDRRGEANSLGGLGNAYYSLGQYQQAIDFHQQWLNIAREIGDRRGESASLGNLGIAYRSLGQYQQAIDFHQQSLEIKREIGDRQGEANSLGGLGLAYQSLGQYQQAIDFHQQWLNIAREIGDHRGESASLGNLGIAYDSLGQYQQAIDFHQQSLEIKQEIGDRQGEAASLGNLGIAYQSLGQYQQAIDLCQQNLEITREIGDRRGEANSLFNKAIALAKLDRKLEAQSCYEAAQTLYQELGLTKNAEKCETAIRKLGQVIVEVRSSAPTIGDEAPVARKRRQIPLIVWVIVGLVAVLLIGWLFL
ncbi:MAG: tetratricopeptide repeat protein [Cyanobacteria bacterium P01_A01_bin.135]